MYRFDTFGARHWTLMNLKRVERQKSFLSGGMMRHLSYVMLLFGI